MIYDNRHRELCIRMSLVMYRLLMLRLDVKNIPHHDFPTGIKSVSKTPQE